MYIALGIFLQNFNTLNTAIFSDGWVLLAGGEDNLQLPAFKLKIITENLNMQISEGKTKSVTVTGKRLLSVKI